ncbi:MAG: substrate-binding domain-containing protein [Acidimicrobiales bacterium]
MKQHVRAAALVAMLSMGLAACAPAHPSGASASGAGTSTTAAPSSSTSSASGPVTLPSSLSSAYTGWPLPVKASAYAGFKAVKPPYVVGFSNSNMGNTWRAQSLADLQRAFGSFKAKGLVSKLVVFNANNSVSTQITQINDLIAEHVQLLLVNAASSTGLDPVIRKAYAAGIVVVPFNNVVNSTAGENRDVNQAIYGANLATGLAKLLHGHGNVVMIEGIPGAAGSVIRENAALAAFRKYPGIHVLANVSGQWTETGAKTAMLNVLATHPQAVAGVWQQGGMFNGVVSALSQDGRPMVPVTMTGMCSAVQWVHSHPGYKTIGSMDPPGGSVLALRVGLRILSGQHPVADAIVSLPPTFQSQAAVSTYYPHCSNPNAWVDPASHSTVSSSLLSTYFANGKPLP